MKKRISKLWPFIASLALSMSASAKTETRLAWMELKDLAGQVIQLEPGFQYSHVAIQVGELWLHADPKQGVVLNDFNELKNLGEIKEVWASQEEDDSYLQNISFFIGKAFDSEFSWSDERIYCAELVAKLLDIPPSPMHFDDKFWDPWFKKYEGLPGSSPSKLYSEAKQRGYHRIF